MTKRIFTLLVLFSTMIVLGKNAKASHMMGADLQFKCLSNDTIQFTLKFYRDCSGISPDNQYNIDIQSATCGIFTSCLVSLVGSPVEVSPLCPSQISQSSCNGGSLPGVQKWEYSGKIYLPTPCTDYVFSWEDCCRNAAITNIAAPGSTGLRVEATWNKAQADCDNSPAFSALPVPYICLNQLINYNHGGYDPDGDSLVYTMVQPLADATSTFTYNPPFTNTYPLTTPSGTVTFNSATGQLTMTPSGSSPLETTVLAIRIDEYRNDTLIGSVMRDIQVVVLNCNNLSPEIVGNDIQNMQGGNQLANNIVEVCPNSTLTFDVFGHDPDNNNLTIGSNISTVLPGGTFNQNMFTNDSGVIHISWTPTVNDTGTYVITVNMVDDACPVFGQAAYSYIINVPKSTDAGPDISLCWPDTVAQLQVVGGTIFTWSPSTGLSTTNGNSPVAIPSQTTTYYVESDLSNFCKNKDTVIVFVLPALSLNPISTPDTICDGAQVHLFAQITGGGGTGYLVNWTSDVGGFNSSQTNPTDNPNLTTMYYLYVTSGSCQQSDSVAVVVRPTPVSTFSVTPINLCPWGNTTINYSLSNAGLTNNWNFGTAHIVSGTNWGPYVAWWNTPGPKPITLTVTDANGCNSSTTITANVHPQPVADFSGVPLSGCSPMDVIFTNASSNGDSLYSWIFGDGGTSTNENDVHTYNTGDWDVTLYVTTYWGCRDTMTKVAFVHVIDHVVADFTVDCVAGQEYDLSEATFHFTNTSQFADSYEWHFGDGTTSTELNPVHTYGSVGAFTVTLIAFNEYCEDTFTFEPIVIGSWNDIVFPSAFTPNNDAHNDFFHELFNKGVINLHYEIFDRWGQLVFETSSVDGAWDGKFKGEDCEVGVYSWSAEGDMLNGNHIYKKGNVTLLR